MHKLLIVDDEFLTRTVLRKYIEDHYPLGDLSVVGEAANGIESLNMVSEHCPDIVLMDVKLPGRSGLTLTQEIKRTNPKTRIVIITAYGEFEFAQRALQLGASDYILKPCLPENLIAVVDRLIEEIQQERIHIEEESQLRDKLKEVMPYIKISLGYDLLSSSEHSRDSLVSRLEFVGEKSHPSLIIVVSIDQIVYQRRQFSYAEREDLKNKVFKSVNSAIDGSGSFALPLGRDEIVVFFVSDSDTKEMVEEEAFVMSGNIRNLIQRDNNIEITIGIGTHYSLEKLRLSYEEAVEALQLGSFFIGVDKIIQYCEIGALMKGSCVFPVDQEMNLVDAVKLGNRHEAVAIGRGIVADLLTRDNLYYAKFYLNGLISVISRILCQSGGCFLQLSDYTVKYTSMLARIEDGKALFPWIEELVESHIDHLQRQKTGEASNAVQKVIDYMEKNYNREISLDDISQLFFINPVYFCRLFKAKMGVTFVEHLTQIRLSRASQLLAYSDHDIREIAELVGFSNPNYFSRVFKKAKNMTPSEYRSLKGKDNTE